VRISGFARARRFLLQGPPHPEQTPWLTAAPLYQNCDLADGTSTTDRSLRLAFTGW
jgi:hypothetical protein